MIAIDQFWRAESTPHRWIELREVGEEVKPATNVYALRPGLSCFYPAIVQAKIHNGKFLVSFPDGAMAEVQLRDMRKDELRVGDRVFNWRFRPYGSETRRVTKIKAGMITTDGSYGGDRAHRIDLALSVHDIEWQAWGDRMFKEDCEVVCMYGRE
ncbi:hypothetical protein C8R45DRAFT_437516 [Mycena sanguinolenta]|nr:hypothetical protein C8R45DRAFT_437516 [Mycena sanguinolenta]